MALIRAERLTTPVAFHGEGPVWDAEGERLLIVDMLAGDVIDLGDSATPVRHHLGGVAAALRPRAGGGFVAALERGFVLLDDRFAVEASSAEAFSDPAVRMNDGGCDPQGRFYCGSMAYDETRGAGALYRVDAALGVSTVLTGMTISNGLQWSLDGTRVFYNDTPTGRIDVFDFDGSDGSFRRRRGFAAVPPGAGLPDGMAIDAEGGIWTALWGGGRVYRFDPDGALSAVVDVPGVTNTSACAFGGEGLRTLFITTSRQYVPDGEQPDAGAVFVADPGVAGAPLPAFAG